MRITVVTAGAFVARADGWRVSFAAAAAVAVVADGFSNSVSHVGQKRLKNRSDDIMEWALKMRRKHTMFKGERQCPTFNRNSIGSGRIEGAPGLRMRRAGDANSETETALGGRPSASRWWLITRVGRRNNNWNGRWSVEGGSLKAW
jgi:hypothetical protein